MKLSVIKKALAQRGLDIVQYFDPKIYNDFIKNTNCTLEPLAQNNVGLLVGNSKALWPFFLDFLTKCNPVPTDPLDTYVMQTVNTIDAQIYYSFESGKRLVHFQKLCELSGLGAFDSSCGLCIHSTYGPWFALRAVVLLKQLEIDSENISPPLRQPNSQAQALFAQFNIEYSKLKSSLGHSEAYKRTWHLLVEMRRALAASSEYEYSQQQIDYHYQGKMPSTASL